MEQWRGRLVKLTGDGFLAEFSAIQDAVSCACFIQERLSASVLDLRIGIHLGDVLDDGADIHGEGVNIAARIEALADPGGICISAAVHEQVRNRLSLSFEDLGERDVKHVTAPVRVFRIREPGEPKALSSPALPDAPDVPTELTRAVRPSIAVLPFENQSNDPEQEYFSDGVCEDIITALERFR